MIGDSRPGSIAEFDDEKGFGTVRDDDGRTYFFHCTAIANGTRTIDEGAAVVFDVVPGRLGRWEAVQIRSR